MFPCLSISCHLLLLGCSAALVLGAPCGSRNITDGTFRWIPVFWLSQTMLVELPSRVLAHVGRCICRTRFSMGNNWVKGCGHVHFGRDSPVAPKGVESLCIPPPAPPTVNIRVRLVRRPLTCMDPAQSSCRY